MSNETVCHHCRKSLGLPAASSVQFRASCPHCHADSHVCLNCDFHDEGAHHECREPSAEWVRDKQRANRCEYFRLRASNARADSAKADVLAALDSLFKK